MSAGTIKLTNGSTAVVGTSTTFTSDLKSGDVISTTISGAPYTLFVDTVTSNTALTLSDAFTGPTTTGAAYVAVPQMTLNRITAALAAQTAEAVRRVLQENANWQAFYSGSGDITVTLPNGTPTGVQIPGPSWAKMQTLLANKLQLRGEIGATDNINTYGVPNETYVGVWLKNAGASATIANGFPEDDAIGILEVFPFTNNYNGIQRYTVRGGVGRQYIRYTTAVWNGANGPWSDWYMTGDGSLNKIGLGLSGLSNAAGLDWQNGDFITGTITRYQWSTFTNPPTLTGPQPAATANIVVTVKMVIGTTAVVELAAVRGATAYECYDVIVAGAKGSRTLTVRMTYQRGMGTAVAVSDGGTGATTPAGARTAFGFDDMGIGLSLSPLIANFDWQQADFITGSLQTFQFSASLNQPSGITYGSTTSVTVTTLQNRTSLIVVKVVPLTQSNGNRREYTVTISGAKGARTFTVNQNFNDDSSTTISLGNGGTGATTAAAARTNLGLKGAAILDVGAVAGTVAAGDDSRLGKVDGKTGGAITSKVTISDATLAAGAQPLTVSKSVNSSGTIFGGGAKYDLGAAYNQEGVDMYVQRNTNGERLFYQRAINGDGVVAATFAFSSNGNYYAYNGSFTNGSDVHIKYDIERIINPLDKMKALKGVTYRLKANDAFGIGFIAQDVEDVFPEAVSQSGFDQEMPDGSVVKNVKGINAGNIAAALHHEAILALMEKIESLETRLAKLEPAEPVEQAS